MYSCILYCIHVLLNIQENVILYSWSTQLDEMHFTVVDLSESRNNIFG